jgi:hypothetical protein
MGCPFVRDLLEVARKGQSFVNRVDVLDLRKQRDGWIWNQDVPIDTSFCVDDRVVVVATSGLFLKTSSRCYFVLFF